MERRFNRSLLLVAVLILAVAINVLPVPLVNAPALNKWISRPQSHSASISVANPTQAYDEDPGTLASFTYSSGTGEFALINPTVPTLVENPLPAIQSVDFTMRYYAAPNTAASPDDRYRITYYLGATPAATPLLDWNYVLYKDLYVNGFDDSKTDWLRFGVTPYLGAIDTTNYIREAMGVLLRPDNNGYHTAWTGAYTDWDDTTPDGDTTKISATADNLNESSTIQNPSAPLPTGAISKVMVTINASNTLLSDEELMIMLRVGGKDYFGHQEIFAPSTSYGQIESYWTLNPATESPWTWNEINNLEVGVQSVQVGGTWTGELRVTQMFVEVFCVNARIGDFSFEDIDPAFNVGIVELEIYARDMGPGNNDMVELTVYDGSTWTSIGALTPGSGWSWGSVVGPDVTTILDTPAKINAAKVFLTKLTVDGGRNEPAPAIEEIQVDAMRLRVYTQGYLEDVTTVTWADQPRPGGGSWTWTDISNLKFAVDTEQIGTQDEGCAFELYEAWITINLPNAKVKVHPQSEIDYSLKPQTPTTMRPDGDGFFTAWTGTYTDWDDTTQDGDATYVSTTSGYQRESSSLQDPTPEAWEIAGVRVVVYARYATGGMDELLTPTLVFDTRYERAAPQSFSLTTSYEEYSYTWGVNPYTNALWSWADINNLHAGVLSESVDGWSGEMRITQLYVEIIGPRFTVDVHAEDVVNLVLYDFTVSYETSALTATGLISASPFGGKFLAVVEDTITTVTGESVGEGDNYITVFTLEQPRVLCGSETIYLNGVPQTRFTDYTIDYKTGQITFADAPGHFVAITADYEYPAYVRVSYSMGMGSEEGASGNRTLATLVFVVDGYGMTFLDLYDVRLSDPSVATIYSNTYNGYFRNTLLGDADGDADVDYDDFIMLAGAYGSGCGQAGYQLKADFDIDGDVDYDDFIVLAGNYGQSVPP